jgi:RNA polymerase sigma-70 factor, ECF subfamily
MSVSAAQTIRDRPLLAAAREGDERAWRGLERFEGRGELRAARERRARVHRRAPAPSGHAARSADPARARAAVRDRVPEQSQQATLRSLGDEGVRELVGRYVSAWERCDIEAFIAMLAEDATFAMPPLRNWYRGRDVIAAWVSRSPMSGEWRWRTQPARANGQIAFGFYAWNATEEAHLAFALNVLTIRGSEVADVTAFIARSAEPRARELFARYPDEPPDAGRVGTMFGRFGLASRLD